MKIYHLLLFFTLTTSAYAQESLSDFKVDDNGDLVEWTDSPDDAVSLDSQLLYDGRPSVKFDRRDISVSTASSILRRIPINFDAQVVELRAVLRAKNSGPYAGANIFLRQDMDSKPIEFINSQPFVTGTRDTEWQPVRVSQKLNPRADSLVIGSVLLGPGEAWINDIQLWVDGELLTTFVAGNHTRTKHVADNRGNIPSIDVDWSNITDHTARDVSAFIQVWGFLKYFHPDVATDAYDWDREFVEATQALVMGSELNDVLLTLLKKVGVPDKQTDIEPTKQGKVIATTTSAWYADDKVFSPEVIAALTIIQSQRQSFKESQYAVSDDLAMASFTEEDYFQIGHLEHETRLLALARLWNIIEYWFPWDELPTTWYTELPDLTKQIIQSTDRSEFLYVLQRVLGQINDGHARLTDSVFQKGSCRLPFTVRHIDGQVVISKLYKDLSNQDVKIGDVIVALDDENIDDLIERWLPLYSASNASGRYYGLANELLYRSCEEPTVVALSRHSHKHEVSISDYEAVAILDHSLPGDVVQTLDNDVTYLKVAGVNFPAVDEAIKKAQESGKLIIDVRGYPSEFILYYLGSRLTQDPLPFAQLARVNPQFPGTVSLIDHIPTIEPSEPVSLDGIAILVDETTFSQSEYSVLAWRELPNAKVIGSTTAGAVGNVSIVPLPNGMQAYFTGLRVLNKNGQDVQYTGIEPDIYVKPTIADLQSGRDVVIDKALEWLGSASSEAAEGESSQLLDADTCFRSPFGSYSEWLSMISANTARRISDEAKIQESLNNFKSLFPEEKFEHYRQTLECQTFKYQSGEALVNGYVIRTKNADRKLPVIIYNRGGNGNYGSVNMARMVGDLFPLAAEDFIVVGTQYRGTFERDRKYQDEFGGADVRDVTRLFELLPEIPSADTNRIGMLGTSRGAMQSYLALRKDAPIKALATIAGNVDLLKDLETRPAMEKVYANRIPNYEEKKESELRDRSAIHWISEISSDVPILLIHGESDDRVNAANSIAMAEELERLEREYKLVIYPQDGHDLRANKEAAFKELVQWFDTHL